jgi:hypothetical protein
VDPFQPEAAVLVADELADLADHEDPTESNDHGELEWHLDGAAATITSRGTTADGGEGIGNVHGDEPVDVHPHVPQLAGTTPAVDAGAHENEADDEVDGEERGNELMCKDELMDRMYHRYFFVCGFSIVSALTNWMICIFQVSKPESCISSI